MTDTLKMLKGYFEFWNMFLMVLNTENTYYEYAPLNNQSQLWDWLTWAVFTRTHVHNSFLHILHWLHLQTWLSLTLFPFSPLVKFLQTVKMSRNKNTAGHFQENPANMGGQGAPEHHSCLHICQEELISFNSGKGLLESNLYQWLKM